MKSVQKTQSNLKHLGLGSTRKTKSASGRRSYLFECPECKIEITDKLARHLINEHNYNEKMAKFKQSEMRILYSWSISDKHRTPLPAPCYEHNIWCSRIDHHARDFHPNLDQTQKKIFIESARNAVWKKGVATSSSTATLSSSSSTATEEFILRSKPAELDNNIQGGASYVPLNAKKLNDLNRVEWGIKNSDYFSIYYNNVGDLLDAFQKDLEEGTCQENLAMASQHRNAVELVWSTISSEMEMFPTNALSNLHLLSDKYLKPSFSIIGQPGGVQAGTLRSRNTSLTTFISFLRREHIFAGFSRDNLKQLEKALDDNNKKLHPKINQRKVDIRRFKAKTLLAPAHFVKYGSSEFVQNLLNNFIDYKKNPDGFLKFVGKPLATQFRDYIITTLCIFNGLRPSNIIELRIKDFHEYSVNNDYPGNKIISNSKYKTSSIYGEKFIVISDLLYEQCIFYINKLRLILTPDTKSKRVFLPKSENLKMSQTNVSNSLTASFSSANVFSESEFKRVSCTRIRCGIATYACNEGGFDEAFFAKHFMKNREQTTSIHYNIKANQRNALAIGMQLQKTFSYGNESVHIEPEDIKTVTERLNHLSIPAKNKVITWLKINNPDLSDGEIKEMEKILDELNVGNSSNNSTFYGKVCI